MCNVISGTLQSRRPTLIGERTDLWDGRTDGRSLQATRRQVEHNEGLQASSAVYTEYWLSR